MGDNCTYAWREIAQRIEGRQAFAANWYIRAPWAHLAWSEYVLAMVDLTTDLGKPPVVHLPGATHEFLLYGIDPNTPLKRGRPAGEQRFTLLTPPNHGFQFRAPSDEHAVRRLQVLVDQIVRHELSPDTDFGRTWDRLFADGVSLRKGALAEAETLGRG